MFSRGERNLPITEQQLVHSIIEYLLLSGHYVWRNNTGAVRSTYTTKAGIRKDRFWRAGIKGSSDILGVAKDGKMIAIECKVGKNQPTEAQSEFILEIASRGGYATVAWTLDDVISYMDK